MYAGQHCGPCHFHDHYSQKEISMHLRNIQTEWKLLSKRKLKIFQEMRENLRALINSMDDFVFVFQLGWLSKITTSLPRTEALYAPPEEIIGKHYRDVLPPQVTGLLQAAMKKN